MTKSTARNGNHIAHGAHLLSEYRSGIGFVQTGLVLGDLRLLRLFFRFTSKASPVASVFDEQIRSPYEFASITQFSIAACASRNEI